MVQGGIRAVGNLLCVLTCGEIEEFGRLRRRGQRNRRRRPDPEDVEAQFPLQEATYDVPSSVVVNPPTSGPSRRPPASAPTLYPLLPMIQYQPG